MVKVVTDTVSGKVRSSRRRHIPIFVVISIIINSIIIITVIIMKSSSSSPSSSSSSSSSLLQQTVLCTNTRCVTMPSLMDARWVGQNSGPIFRSLWTKVHRITPRPSTFLIWVTIEHVAKFGDDRRSDLGD